MPGAHLITTNYEILGGPATARGADRERQISRRPIQKPTRRSTTRLSEAIDIINKDKRAAAEALSRGRAGHQKLGRRHSRHHQRQGLRLHAQAGKSVQDRAVHGQDRLDQAVAGGDRRSVLPREGSRWRLKRQTDRMSDRRIFASAPAPVFPPTGSIRRSISPSAASSTSWCWNASASAPSPSPIATAWPIRAAATIRMLERRMRALLPACRAAGTTHHHQYGRGQSARRRRTYA